jgi:hypothetical protein
MRLISRVLVVLAFFFVAITLPPVPAQAQCGGPFVELSPKSGLPGTEVSVYGYQFSEGVLVDIYYDGDPIATDIRTSSRGDFTIFFTIPECGKGHYQVLAAGKYASIDTYFTVKPGLTVTPDDGPVGTTVAVKGMGFAKNEEGIELRYYFNDNYETIERNIVANAKGSWETSFQIPSSTRGEHDLDAEGAVSRLYEVRNVVFRVTAEIIIDKSSGIAGDIITMTGSRFAANEKGIKILFDDQVVVTDIEANSNGEWEASFQVPEMPTGEYNLTAEGEQTNKEDIGELSFEIEPDIVLSAYEGHVGMDLTVTGRGFAANEDVNIMYDDSQVTTARTSDKGSFDVSFPVPKSQHGECLVTAGYDATNAANTIFTMESDPPPTPTLISPASKSRLGFMGEVAPTFEWSEVSDDSGVSYSLQVATSADFATSSVIVSVMDWTEGSYTLTEPLSYGTYYWIVRAVDGAENESDWTAARSFRVGLLPLWGLIAIIVAIVVLLGALIRALIIRRTIYYDRW